MALVHGSIVVIPSHMTIRIRWLEPPQSALLLEEVLVRTVGVYFYSWCNGRGIHNSYNNRCINNRTGTVYYFEVWVLIMFYVGKRS